MRVRAIADLDQLSDSTLFDEVAEGLAHIADHVVTVDAHARKLLSDNNPRGGRILRAIAQEEAGKYLILLDAIRCPRIPGSPMFANHVRRFNEHLAKAIYGYCCKLRPGTLGELRKWINEERQQYYLDGPNDIDWIFSNRLVRDREESFYVDYQENDGNHFWMTPEPWDRLAGGAFDAHAPAVVRLVEAMHASGFSKSAALAGVAQEWRDVSANDDLDWRTLTQHNADTLNRLETIGALGAAPDDTYRLLIAEWIFPLYSTDLAEIKVSQAALRDIQASWTPGEYYY
jgi:AbiV family abortive infection protein